jgi:hypothetical protein
MATAVGVGQQNVPALGLGVIVCPWLRRHAAGIDLDAR